MSCLFCISSSFPDCPPPPLDEVVLSFLCVNYCSFHISLLKHLQHSIDIIWLYSAFSARLISLKIEKFCLFILEFPVLNLILSAWQAYSKGLWNEWKNEQSFIFWHAAAKSLQSCPTLCDPIDGSPPGSPVPGILQARTLDWVAISLSNAWKWKVKMKSLSRAGLLATPRTAAYQTLPSMDFLGKSTTELYNLSLDKSTDAEQPWILRANYKLYMD